jgi:sugar lactone lactonase YvrE
VIGQPTFTSVAAGGGAGPFVVAGNGLNLPSGVVLDGTSLWIADTENNRVVRWDDIFGTPTPAAWLGQPNGTTVANPNYQFAPGVFQGYLAPQPPTTASSILRPYGVVVVAGNLYVTETDSNRLHVFDKQSLSVTAVVGQIDDTTAAPNVGGVSAGTLSEPMGLGSDGTNLWVADNRNARVLGYPLAALSSGSSATQVVGQPSFVANGFNAATLAAGGSFAQPAGLRLTSAGELFSTDPNNHRVLIYDTTVTPATLKGVIGQADSNGNSQNGGGPIGPTGLDAPHGVWADPATVLVADTQNNRVLVFDRATSMSSAVAVVGQSSMTTNTPNVGGVSASSLLGPSDVCSDGTRVAVVDTGNSRVLVWNSLPTQNGQPADAILAQPVASTGSPNLGTGIAGINSAAFPTACVFAPEGLYLADTGNNRVLLFTQLSTGVNATAVLGQFDAASRVPAASIDDTIHLAGPSGLAFDGVNLYVADRDLGRVVVIRDPKDGGAIRSIISGSGQGYQPTGGIAVARTAFFTSQLFASDANSHRVFRVSSVSRLGQ